MKIFLDDIRTSSKEQFDVICRSSKEIIDFILKNGAPNYISFDHDLGEAKTGYDVAKWIVEQDILGNISIPEDFQFHVHSANPVGKINIEKYLTNYINFKNKNK